jgi:hypothetical protein
VKSSFFAIAGLPNVDFVSRWASALWQHHEPSQAHGLSQRRSKIGTKAHQGKGGVECLFDRLLCVRDEKRTATEENNAHTLALKRDKYEDMAEFPKEFSRSV